MKKEDKTVKMGRPPSKDPINHNIKIGLNEKLFNQITEYSKKKGNSIAETVRQALILLFKNNK